MANHYKLHLEKADEFYNDGNYEAAKAAAQHAIECALSGEGDEARTILALSLRKLEYNDEALQMLTEIVETAPSPEALAEFALIKAERGLADDDCLNCAQHAIDEDPDLPSAYMAMFWCMAAKGDFLDAVRFLKKGLYRGGCFDEARAFDIIRGWCQAACDQDNLKLALDISAEAVDFFDNMDFSLLHARLAEAAGDCRTAVSYYKKSLAWLRTGSSIRIDVLETIARIAV